MTFILGAGNSLLSHDHFGEEAVPCPDGEEGFTLGSSPLSHDFLGDWVAVIDGEVTVDDGFMTDVMGVGVTPLGVAAVGAIPFSVHSDLEVR